MPSTRYLKYRDKILAYAREHREQANVIKQAYVERYPDRVKASKQKWADAHHEERHLRSQRAYQDNKEHFIEQMRRWKEANPEKDKESQKARRKRYEDAHPIRVQIAHREWRSRNKDYVLALNRRWVEANPEKKKAADAKYRASKYNAPINDFTRTQWEEMKAHYGYRCVYCGKKPKRLTKDHITPLSKGGSHTRSNILPACRPCNSRKNNRAVLKPVQPLLL